MSSPVQPSGLSPTLRSRITSLLTGRRLRTGSVVSGSGGLPGRLQSTSKVGFDFAALDLSPGPDGDFSFSDRELPSRIFSNNVVGLLSIEALDDAGQRSLLRQLDWATHLSLPSVICPSAGVDPALLARALKQQALVLGSPRIWVRVPWAGRSDPWGWWNAVRSLTDYDRRITLCLEITKDVPTEWQRARWLAEPVACALVPSDLFGRDPKHPALGAPQQEMIKGLLRRTTDVVLIEPAAGITPADLGPHRSELGELFGAAWADVSERDQVSADFSEQLTPPIQPLRDNILSSNYEHFEQATVKYVQYEQAITAALGDLGRASKRPLVVMVVGAGRGPLVQRAIQASQAAKVPIDLYAVEKNPNAAVTIRHRNRTEWAGRVKVIEQDMRRWEPPVLADILVSELLGSFGDNELSPECLDGAQRLLKPGGISIPADSTSYVAPLFAPVLYGSVGRGPADLEMPYGVDLLRGRQLAELSPCFVFQHPNPKLPEDFADNRHNERYTALRFAAEGDGVLHGFVGYFESRLYGNVLLSTHPKTRSGAEVSWAPIWFPLRSPVQVKAGETIEACFWRCVRAHHVWYEWALTAPEKSAIHNPGGRSYTIGS